MNRKEKDLSMNAPLLNGSDNGSDSEYSGELETTQYSNGYSIVDKKDRVLFEGTCPLDSAGLFSRLSFSWVNPLIAFCNKERLSSNLLGNMMKNQSINDYQKKFEISWDKYKNNDGH